MKHHCILEITQPNIHSELYKARFVKDYGENYNEAKDMRQSMNNNRPKSKITIITNLGKEWNLYKVFC